MRRADTPTQNDETKSPRRIAQARLKSKPLKMVYFTRGTDAEPSTVNDHCQESESTYHQPNATFFSSSYRAPFQTIRSCAINATRMRCRGNKVSKSLSRRMGRCLAEHFIKGRSK